MDAWAVLDGGIVHVFGYGLTTLPSGAHIVGLQAFRLILAELGYAVPDGLTKATTVHPDELRRRLRAIPADDPSAREQADLLATCTDAVLLRWVAATLLAEYGTTGSGTHPTPGAADHGLTPTRPPGSWPGLARPEPNGSFDPAFGAAVAGLNRPCRKKMPAQAAAARRSAR